MAAFTYALKASESKRQYPRRFKIFLDYLNLKGALVEQAEQFYLKASKDLPWCEQNLMAFVEYEKERARRGEISECTIPNYYRATKLFCEMNDIILNWKKISRGLPRAGKADNDRAPTLEEIKRIVEYPDRRIKSIVYTMASSGIRIGAWDYLKWKHIIPLFNDTGDILNSYFYSQNTSEQIRFWKNICHDCQISISLFVCTRCKIHHNYEGNR
jgi:hypothetical protein